MDLRVILGDWLDVGVPTIFSLHFPYSLFILIDCGLARLDIESLRKRVITILRERSALVAEPDLWLLGHLLPVMVGSSQEWNRVSELLSALNRLDVFPSIRGVSIEDVGSCIKRGREGALSGSHCRAVLGSVLDAEGLHSLSSHRFAWSILSKEFRVSHG